MKVIDVNKERRGPRTEPWGTPGKIVWIVELWLLIDKLFSIGQIKAEPVLCSASYPVVLKFLNKYLMINHIKCFFHV